MKWQRITKVLHWLLLVVAALLIISGLGVSYFRVVETVTFGLLTKPLAFKIHTALWIPFALLLVSHVIVSIVKNKRR